jgi:hypothetical protein
MQFERKRQQGRDESTEFQDSRDLYSPNKTKTGIQVCENEETPEDLWMTPKEGMSNIRLGSELLSCLVPSSQQSLRGCEDKDSTSSRPKE